MEKICFKIALAIIISFLIYFTSCSSKKSIYYPIKGHWAAYFGDTTKSYGETIYGDGQFCAYNDEVGLVYRDYIIRSDSVIEVYKEGILDHKRIILFLDSNTMIQAQVLNDMKTDKIVRFERIRPIDVKKVFAFDTLEQDKFISEFTLRKALFEMNNK